MHGSTAMDPHLVGSFHWQFTSHPQKTLNLLLHFFTTFSSTSSPSISSPSHDFSFSSTSLLLFYIKLHSLKLFDVDALFKLQLDYSIGYIGPCICTSCIHMQNTMCLSLLRTPKFPHHATTSWWCCLPNFTKRCNAVSAINIICSSNSDLDRKIYRRQTRKAIDTRSLSSKAVTENDTSKEAANAKVDTLRSLASGVENTQFFRIHQLIAEPKDLSKHVTFITFDLETTGFSRQRDRIIEVAFQDLAGGMNSTLQTLVNPQRSVTNHRIHNITAHMVSRPEVPRMVDLIPILMKWIESRRKPDGIVVLIAHNARSFDVPFLNSEFSRCSYKFPSHWFFLDTLPLAREVIKSRGSTGNAKLSLGALCDLYEIPVPSNAHRALVDVKMLSLVYQKMTFELEFSIRRILEEVCRQSDASNLKKKKAGGKP